jgi:hypothetical protein
LNSQEIVSPRKVVANDAPDESMISQVPRLTSVIELTRPKKNNIMSPDNKDKKTAETPSVHTSRDQNMDFDCSDDLIIDNFNPNNIVS